MRRRVHHALDADFETRALRVFRAAADSAEDQFVGFAVAQPYVDFYVADGGGDVVDDTIEDGFEVEGGGDQKRGALKLHEGMGEVTRSLNARREGVCGLG